MKRKLAPILLPPRPGICKAWFNFSKGNAHTCYRYRQIVSAVPHMQMWTRIWTRGIRSGCISLVLFPSMVFPCVATHGATLCIRPNVLYRCTFSSFVFSREVPVVVRIPASPSLAFPLTSLLHSLLQIVSRGHGSSRSNGRTKLHTDVVVVLRFVQIPTQHFAQEYLDRNVEDGCKNSSSLDMIPLFSNTGVAQ